MKAIYRSEEIRNAKDGDVLYKMIEELIINNEKIYIKYIVNPERNPEYTREVNKCFYILLASLCLNIASDQILLVNEIIIKDYYDKLKEIYNILYNLNNDLYLYLNEI